MKLKKDGSAIKPEVDRTLSEGAAYILFTTTNLVDTRRETAKINIKEMFNHYGRAYSNTVHIDIYDSAQIATWTNQYFPAVLAVREWLQLSVPEGFQTFPVWKEFMNSQRDRVEFIPDPKLEGIMNDIAERLVIPRETSRIVGLSGIGKTEITFQVCNQGLIGELCNSLIYVDAADAPDDLPSKVRSLIGIARTKFCLIVDNCEPCLHSHLQNIMSRTDGTLVTIDTTIEEHVCDNTLVIPPASKELIQKIVTMRHPDLSEENIRRIVEFADGFPLIAVILARDIKSGAHDIGNLLRDDIKAKLLGDFSPDHEKSLQACALFSYVGFDGEHSDQSKYIASKIISPAIPYEDFYRCIKNYEKRRLIDKRGDYRRVIPRPLAVRLAADWWQENPQERIRQVIECLSPEEAPKLLSEAFCRAIRQLSFVQEAIDFTETLCGQQSPFGQAEVLKSEWGSRLFREFVEVNPEATTDAIYSFSEKLTLEQIQQDLVSKTRRNLVEALEKLCFRRNCFDKAAWVMLRFAASENEGWANNATGLFTQLFQVHLSGTEAPPELRIRLIERALQLQDPNITKVIIQALGRVFRQHVTRATGAENQGTGPQLIEWAPKYWKEIFGYWEASMDYLIKIILEEPHFTDLVKAEIASHMREIVRYGRVDMLDNAITQITKHTGKYWPEALNSIRQIKEFDGEKLPPKGHKMLKKWETMLIPENLKEQIQLYVCTPPWEHKKGPDGSYIDVSSQNAKRFAEECANTHEGLLQSVDILIQGEIRQGYIFGKTFVSFTGDYHSLLDSLLDSISKIDPDNSNTSVIAGLLAGIQEISMGSWETYMERIASDEKLARFYVQILRLSSFSHKHLWVVLDLFRRGLLPLFQVRLLSYGSVLDHIESKHISEFCIELSKISCESNWVALELLYMYSFDNKDHWRYCEESFEQIVLKLDITRVPENLKDVMCEWACTVQKLLHKKNTAFVDFVTESVFDICYEARNSNVSVQDHDVQQVLGTLVYLGYYESILDNIAGILQTANPIAIFNLGFLLTSSRDESGEYRHILMKFPEDLLLKWADNNPDFGPQYVAEATPLYVTSEVDEPTIHPLVKRLVRQYGDNIDVLHNLSSFAGCKTYWGGRETDLEAEKKVYLELFENDNPKVRDWAEKNIKGINRILDHERKRREERDWGIY